MSYDYSLISTEQEDRNYRPGDFFKFNGDYYDAFHSIWNEMLSKVYPRLEEIFDINDSLFSKDDRKNTLELFLEPMKLKYHRDERDMVVTKAKIELIRDCIERYVEFHLFFNQIEKSSNKESFFTGFYITRFKNDTHYSINGSATYVENGPLKRSLFAIEELFYKFFTIPK